MFLHLLAHESGIWSHRYGLFIALLLLSAALLVNGWRRSEDLVFEGDNPSFGRRSTWAWPLRPSNILIVLGFGFYIYKALQGPGWDVGGNEEFISGLIVALACVVREWERGL